jgi:Fur family ferric uptake transcriptional regulator
MKLIINFTARPRSRMRGPSTQRQGRTAPRSPADAHSAAPSGRRPATGAAASPRPRDRRSPRERIAEHIRTAGLKRSRQRDRVVDAFLSTTGHVSIDELLEAVHHRDPEIGHTTVYRTMKLLAECGVASPRRFGDGQTRYEMERPDAHHDHLLCEGCGSIEEFEDDGIEELQRAVARRHGFVLDGHTLELHGMCARCRTGGDRRTA